LVEQGIENPRVGGSIPSSATSNINGLQQCRSFSFVPHPLRCPFGARLNRDTPDAHNCSVGTQSFPFTCRKADPDDPFLRELLVSYGTSGYVALYEIEGDHTVTILAVRHQREDDYH
jgi:hypothetical protein